MRFPQMSSNNTFRINIPQMSGGVNLKDAPNMVNDNQLTECENMVYDGQVLRTRHGIAADLDSAVSLGAHSAFVDTGIRKTTNDKQYKLFSCITSGNYLVSYYVADDGSYERLPNMYLNASVGHMPVMFSMNGCIYIVYAKGVYCLASGAESWSQVSNDDIYAPLVFDACLAESTDTFDTEVDAGNYENMKKPIFTGTQLEGYNLLGNRYRMVYTMLNISSDAYRDSGYANMLYPLPFAIPGGGKLKVKITDQNNGVAITHTVTYTENTTSYEQDIHADNLLIIIPKGGNMFLIEFRKPVIGCEYSHHITDKSSSGSVTDSFCYVNALHNNMEVTVEYAASMENGQHVDDKLKNSSIATWFGGTADGINGGTRLFVSGCSMQNQENLIMWSDLNNPLYFSENNYSYVGGKSKITALCKQSSMLVIFKEHEIYYTAYSTGTAPTTESVQNQSIIDVTTSLANFPLVQITGNIGCDCPNTVQMLNNRLTWATSGGRVYCLVSASQYSETNVYELSQMVESQLKTETAAALKSAVSADYGGKYWLFIGNKAYSMDYQNYGFKYVYSETKTEERSRMIPWYILRLPVSVTGAVFFDHSMMMFADTVKCAAVYSALYNIASVYEDSALSVDDNSDFVLESGDIEYKMRTKSFDFGKPERMKRVQQMYVGMWQSGIYPICAEFITDRTQTDISIMDSVTDGSGEDIKRIVPVSPASRRFGVRFTGKGGLKISSFAFNCKILNSVR